MGSTEIKERGDVGGRKEASIINWDVYTLEKIPENQKQLSLSQHPLYSPPRILKVLKWWCRWDIDICRKKQKV